MKAVTGELPTDDGWVFELKWDGMRLVVRIDDGEVLAHSSNGNDVTVRFPELTELAANLGDLDVVLDGEVVAFGDDGRPSFGRLQHRMHVATAESARLRRADTPTVYAIFDVLEIDRRSTVGLGWTERRRLLEQLVDPGPTWTLSTVHTDGEALFAAAVEQRLEGVMAKRADSPYQPGRRTPNWRKVKVRRRQEFVVGGWALGKGSRAVELASLAVGVHDGPELRFAGRVGSGITRSVAEELRSTLEPLETAVCPFEPPPPPVMTAGMNWVEPVTVVEVAFGEWTGDGRLRHPSYLGRRVDVDPGAVVREP